MTLDGPIRTPRLELQPAGDHELQFAIARADTGELVGGADALLDPADPDVVAVVMSVTPEQQGHGFGVEAMSIVLDHLFTLRGARRVVTTPDSPAAAHLLVRLGFTPADDGRYELTVERWLPD